MIHRPFRPFFVPLLELNNTSSNLLDMQWRVLSMSEVLRHDHPDAAQALHQANVEIQSAIRYLQNQQWVFMLALRQELQQHLRQYGTWPSL